MTKQPPKGQKQKALTVVEVAQLLGDSERAVWQRIYRGMLPHRRWGKRVIILENELNEFLQNLPGPTIADVIAKSEAAAR